MRHRYTLSRRFETGRGRCLFVMLNPSTADARNDDPTIRRCIGFAHRWGYATLRVANLFALRGTDPRGLRAHDPMLLVGPRNDVVLRRECAAADLVVAAWGAHGAIHDRERTVLGMLPDVAWHCLGRTKAGHPRHPLRLSYGTALRRFRAGRQRTGRSGDPTAS